MITTIFVLSSVSTVILFVLIRRWRESEPRRALIAKGFLEFTVPLAVASLFFFALQWWLNARPDAGDTTTIAQLEHSIRLIRATILKPLILPALAQFFVILALVIATVILPWVRRSRVLQRYRGASVWITRAYILFTFLASFSFLGHAYNGNASRVEAQLNRQIDEIDREYATAFAGIEQRVAATAAQQIASDPAFASSLPPVTEIQSNQAAAAKELAATREAVRQIPHVELREFQLAAIDNVPDSAPPKPAAKPAETPKSGRENWNRHDGMSLVRELADAGMDVVHEEVAKTILASLFAGTPVEAFAELALDPAVMYDFRDVVADAAAKAFESSTTHRARIGEALRAAAEATRGRAAAFAARASEKVTPWLTTRLAKSRTDVAAARASRHTVTAELTQKANDQAAREAEQLRLDIVGVGALAAGDDAGREVAESILADASGRGMDRVAQIREIRDSIGLSTKSTAERIEALTTYEARNGRTSFKEAVDMRLQEALWPEREGRWGELRGETYLYFMRKSLFDGEAKGILRIIEGWESYKRKAAMEILASGERPTSQTWEEKFHEYCQRHEEMAVMWGWFVKDTNHEILAAKYNVDNVVPEHGYRYYLEQNDFGGERDADRLFSQPVAAKTIGTYCHSN